MKENTVLRVADTFCALAKLGDSVPLPNASQRYKLRMFTMKESSFPSCDLLRECKHGSLADKEEHTVCLIVSDKSHCLDC